MNSNLKVILVLIFSLGGCAASFETPAQRKNYSHVKRELLDLRGRDNPSNQASLDMKGDLLVFDTNVSPPAIVHRSQGFSESDAMYRIQNSGVADPCAVNGERPSIAGFLPPTNVDLPISISLCSRIRDETELANLQKELLLKLQRSTTKNADTVSELLAKISTVADTQDENWQKSIELLEQISKAQNGGG